MKKNLPVILLALFTIHCSSFTASGQVSSEALQFDGVDDYVIIPANPNYLIGTSDFTVEAWIKDNADPVMWWSTEPIFCIGFSSSIYFAVQQGRLLLSVGDHIPLHTMVFESGAFPDLRDSSCHHVAAVRQGNMVHFYRDGTFTSSGALNGAENLGSSEDALIGSNDVIFKGTIKEVKFWSVARTPAEIQSDMFSGTGIGMLGYWRCNETTGIIVNDVYGNNGYLGYPGCGTACYPAHVINCCGAITASINASGPLTFCSGGSVLFTANMGTGLTYQWLKGGNPIVGATGINYTAYTGGNYKVIVSNAGGCSMTSAAINVTVNALPSATITPSGPTTFCSGGSVVLNAPTGANRSYQWKKGANLISGATLSSYTANTGGSYRVIVTNTVTGCSKTTGSATVVTVNALPTATITPQGPTTFCAGGSVVLAANTGAGLTYKWKKGSNFISGATLSNYTATIGGAYKVQVTNSNSCSKTSAGVVVSVPCREGEILSENSFDVKVFPNPAHSELNIVLTSDDNFEIEIVNTLGERIIKEQNENRIDISGLARRNLFY